MTAAVEPLAHQVAARAQKDAGFAQVLDALLAAPTTPQGTLERVAARTLSDQRRASLVQDFVDGSPRTPEVQALLKLRTPQAVHRLRRRGKLIGSAVGNQTSFPTWQFDGGRMRPDLPRILAARASPWIPLRLTGSCASSVTNSATSIAEALRKPDPAETAWLTLSSLGA